MELTEPIEIINSQLVDHFGIDTSTGQSIFRVVWSEDQFENRLTKFRDSGIELLVPEVKLLPKYRQWIIEKYVLERLVIVPEANLDELLGLKLSYEPIWVFQSDDEKYLPPNFTICKFVIDTLYAALGKKSMRKYVDEEALHPIEHQEMRVKKLEEELFGDASGLENKTITGEAIAGFYPKMNGIDIVE